MRNPAIGRNPAVEWPSVHQLHRDVGNSVGLTYVIDCRDVGVAQGTCGPRFAQETTTNVCIAGEFGFENLDGNRTTDFRIVCTVNVGHGAFAKLALYPVTVEPFDHTVRVPSSSIVQSAGDAALK